MRAFILTATVLVFLELALGTQAPPPQSPPPKPPPKVSPKPPPPPPNLRQKNGVRLVGGSGPRGRLEVSTKAYWVTGDAKQKKAGWSPVCDVNFDDDMAQAMCAVLGYSYGRKYYASKLNYPNKPLNGVGRGIGAIYCDANVRRRSLLEADGTTMGSSADGSDVFTGSRRALLKPLEGTINAPAKAPYACHFYIGDCDGTGPLAGLQCSHSPMAPAPPPPPAPPPKSVLIRLVGGNTDSPAVAVEPNLCSGPADARCQEPTSGRVEVQIEEPGIAAGPIWAPLCMSGQGFDLALLICRQVYNWDRFGTTSISAAVSETPFSIPQGSVMAAGDFDPSKYQAWVTVTGGDLGTATKVQDLELQVSSSQCTDGYMFTLMCGALRLS